MEMTAAGWPRFESFGELQRVSYDIDQMTDVEQLRHYLKLAVDEIKRLNQANDKLAKEAWGRQALQDQLDKMREAFKAKDKLASEAATLRVERDDALAKNRGWQDAYKRQESELNAANALAKILENQLRGVRSAARVAARKAKESAPRRRVNAPGWAKALERANRAWA